MNLELLILFIVLTILNVVVGAVKSIVTIKGTKLMAATLNAMAYGINTLAVFYTADDNLELLPKIIIVAITNFVGVYVVKLVEEKKTKDKLWKIECTVAAQLSEPIEVLLTTNKISYKKSDGIDYGVGLCTIFSIYAKTKEQSKKVKELLKDYKVKYFITESQVL
jgi:cytochrome bd-type quinol oxidase subunit 2